MKILVLGAARTGTTYTMQTIANKYKCKFIQEPWNVANPENYKPDLDLNKLPKKIVVKTMIDQFPPIHKAGKSLSPYSSDEQIISTNIDFLTKLVKLFDKVVLLYRSNTVETYESLIYKFFRQKNINNNNWHGTYYFEKDKIPFNKEKYNFVIRNNVIVKKLSKDLGIPLTYYENLFSGYEDIVQKEINKWDLDIDILPSDFDNSFKLRKYSPVKKLL